MSTGAAGSRRINVCFHGVGSPKRELEPGEDAYWVDVAGFESILDEVMTWPDVSLSFDDGNQSDIEVGLPALQVRGLSATFFVIAGRLDQPGSLSCDDLVTLHRHGMKIGSHGMNHRSWRGMDRATTNEELVEARERLSDVVGHPVTEAACPLGLYDRGALSSLRSAGYAAVYTSDRSWARTGRWLQPRFSVLTNDTPKSVRAQVLERPSLPRRGRRLLVGALKRVR